MTEHQMSVYIVSFYALWFLFAIIGLYIWKAKHKALLVATIIIFGYFFSQYLADKITSTVPAGNDKIVYIYDEKTGLYIYNPNPQDNYPEFGTLEK